MAARRASASLGTRRCAGSTSCSSTAPISPREPAVASTGCCIPGGRYAVKDPRAAEECIGENRILRRVAADCIEDTGGLFVTTPFDDPAYAERFGAGCAATGVDCEEIDVVEALRSEPRLNPAISRAFRVPDANIDVWKTVWAMSHGAQQRGARILTYHEAIDVHRSGDRVTGARVRDVRSGEEMDIEAAGHGQCRRRLGRPDRRHGRDRGRPGAARSRDHDRDEPPAGEHGHQPLPDADRRRHPRPDPHRLGDRHHRSAHRRPRRSHRRPGRGRRDVRRRREARPGLPPGAGAARLDRRAAAVRGRQGIGHRHPRRHPRARAARPRAARRRPRLRDDHRRQADDLSG